MPLSITVRELANQNIISLDNDKSVWDAVKLMVIHNIGAVVVTSLGIPVGMITERDVLRKISLELLDSRSVKAGQIMSAPLITIQSGASLGDATSLMLEKGIRRLLVVENDQVIGIFTERDLQRKTLEAFMMLR